MSRSMIPRHSGAAALLALVTTLLLAGTTLAGNATNINIKLPKLPPAGHYSIAGRITAASTGKPVVAASVTVVHPNQPCCAGVDATNAQGRFAVTGLAAGKYTLVVTLGFGHTLQEGWYKTRGAGHFTSSASSASVLTIGTASLTNRNMALPKGYVISGKVTGATYEDVMLVSGGFSYGFTQTDATGRYAFAGLSPGRYEVHLNNQYGDNVPDGCYRAGSVGHFTSDCSQASKLVVKKANVTHVNVTLPVGLTLKGRILHGDGSPAPGSVGVVVGDQWIKFVDAGSDGRFTVQGLAPGSYRVSISNEDFLGGNIASGWYSSANPDHWVSSEADASTIAVAANTNLGTIKPQTARVISGTIKDMGGHPISSMAQIGAWDGNNDGCCSSWANIDSDGSFRITGLNDGTYSLYLDPPYIESSSEPDFQYGFYAAGAGFTTDPQAATQVTVAGADVTGISIKLPKGYSISGKITGPDSKPVVATVSVASTVPAVQRLLDFMKNVGEAQEGGGNSDGTYLFAGLPAGSYTVSVEPQPGPALPTTVAGGWYRAAASGHYTADPTKATPVTIGP